VEEVVRTGVPTVMVVLSGRPYAIGWAIAGPDAPAAVVQAFFPGEEGGTAIAEILTGRTAPSGRLPVSLPRSAGAQPYTYLHPILGGPSEITSADSTPALPFGHGLTYTTFEHTRLTAPGESATSDEFSVTVEVANTGARPGVDVVQLYARDRYASVTRPVAQLVGYARVALDAGERTVVRFQVPSARLAFADRRGVRIVEPGDFELWVGGSCDEQETRATIRLTGPAHEVTAADSRTVAVEVAAAVRA
jgi:beta-glucosidase